MSAVTKRGRDKREVKRVEAGGGWWHLIIPSVRGCPEPGLVMTVTYNSMEHQGEDERCSI